MHRYGKEWVIIGLVNGFVSTEHQGAKRVKLPSYQYTTLHYKDEIVSQSSYLYDGNSMHGKMVIILKQLNECWFMANKTL